MKKKIITSALTLALAAGICGSVYAAEKAVELQINNPVMKINGEEKTIDAPPVIMNGRTLVPVRAIVEALDGTVDWNGETKTATLVSGDNKIELTIDSNTAKLNGEEKSLDTAPVIIDSRTMLPLRFIAEGFGYQTDWEAQTKTIYVSGASEEQPAETETVSSENDNIGVQKNHKQAINSDDCDTFTQIVNKLTDGQAYTNVKLGDTDALLAADSVFGVDGQHNAAEAEVFIYEDGKVKYLGSVASGGSANPIAEKDGMIYTAGHHYIGKHTVTDGALVTVEEAWETFDTEGNVTYHYSSDDDGDYTNIDSDEAREIYDELYEEYSGAKVLDFDVEGVEKEQTENIPLKENKEEAEKQIKAALQKRFEEVYGKKFDEVKIRVDKIYTAKEEQEFDVLKELELGENEVAFEASYDLKPTKDATEDDIMLMLIPNGEYDEKSGWVTGCSRLGVLRPDGDGYKLTNLGTGW
ncbi:MAG: hypothetical protein IKS17_00970 [Firmicutes bacterium]|nr:hypothetical protein [Bacillota bacterium]